MALTAPKLNRAKFVPEGVMSDWFKLFDADVTDSHLFKMIREVLAIVKSIMMKQADCTEDKDPVGIGTILAHTWCYKTAIKNKKNCEVDICRQKFPIDIKKRTQTRGERHLKKCCIQRIEAEDIYCYDVKGIAGMRCHIFPITNRVYCLHPSLPTFKFYDFSLLVNKTTY
ncbi:hypothetical protein B9Z55_001801 [Caenorhabditis nigoni]|uniref:Uncharacterized protein n=1 Tax=Caenorhabditis nigoni TaxID=1611254 RepID=A0A2G5VHH0_9PELO|nr:hypothetical protein B9Z55_001801 [Caenorhabditis nigoni]